MNETKSSISMARLVLITVTMIFSFSSMSILYYLLGLKAIVYLLIAGFFYFIPFMTIVRDFTHHYSHRSGNIYTWIQDNLGDRTAFITILLWYASYFFWMISLFMRIWIPSSILIWGEDLTKQTSSVLGDWKPLVIGCMSVALVAGVYQLAKRGFDAISKLLTRSGSLMVGLIGLNLLSHLIIWWLDGEFITPNLLSNWQQHQSAETAHSLTGFLSQSVHHFLFVITAFGGLDTIGSLLDHFKSQGQKLRRGLMISAGLVILVYTAGIFLWSGSISYGDLHQQEQVNLANLMYELMAILSTRLADCLQLGPTASHLLTQLYLRYTALTLLAAYLSLLSSFIFLPLRTLLTGTPSSYWSDDLIRQNRHGVYERALAIQSGLIALFILVFSLGNHYVTALYNQLIEMTALARSLPYLVIALAYPTFIGRRQGPLGGRRVLGVCVSLCVAGGILLQLQQAWQDNPWHFLNLILGPVFFLLLALTLYRHIQHRQ